MPPPTPAEPPLRTTAQAMPEQIPQGRAGRLWILGRLAMARRGAELLDRKRQLLQRELSSLALARQQTRLRWEEACTNAERWGLRSGVLGGQLDLSLVAGTVTGRAVVELEWRNSMGVRYPGSFECSFPTLDPAELAASNAAMPPAVRAYQAALEAAVAHAVAERAYLSVEQELASTRRRVRAIERHRIPALEEGLHLLELRLDELDREERVVTRWAQQRRTAHRAEPTRTGGGDL